MLNTSHHAQSNFSSRPQALGELVSAWTTALSASCSFFLQQCHPTFQGAALPLHSAWVEVAPLPPASSWRALDPEPANQHSPSPATVMSSGVSTRPILGPDQSPGKGNSVYCRVCGEVESCWSHWWPP